jgi:hypothetical protein
MRNPRAKWWRVLGVTQADADAAKAAVLAYLDAHDNEEEIEEAALRAVHPALANERVWAEVKKALGA